MNNAVIWHTCVRIFLFLSVLLLSGCDSGSFLQENKPMPPEFSVDNLQITPVNRLKGTDKLMTHIGFKQQFIATSRIDGKLVDITDRVDWFSSSPSVAVANIGSALGVATGMTQIYARVADVGSNRVELRVSDANYFKLQVAPDAESHPIGTLQNTLIVGAQQPFTATAIFDDNTSLNVTSDSTWVSSVTSVVSIDTAFAKALQQGQTKISANLKGISSNQVGLTVTPHTLVELQISPVISTVAQGSNIQFHADARYSDNSMQDVTEQVSWSSQQEDIAAFNGNHIEALMPGETTVTASMLGMTSTEKAIITVTDTPMIALQITPAKDTVGIGSQLFYFAKATYADGSTQDVTSQVDWYSTKTEVAEIISGYANTLAAGTTQISATVNELTSNIATLTVNDSYLVGLQVSPAVINLAVNTVKDISVYAIYSDDSTQDVSNWVTWNSTNLDIVGLEPQQVRGLVAGATQINANFNGISSNLAEVTVTDAKAITLQVTPALHTMTTGDMLDYQVLALFDNETTQDVTHQVAWGVAQAAVADVKHGQAVAQAIGSTPIHVYLNGMTSSATLNVTDKYIESIQITPAQATIAAGTQVHFDAIAHYSDNSSADITKQVNWVSSDTNISTVLNGDVAGINPGDVTISVNYQGISSNSAQLIVTDAELTAITVTPASANINVGMTQHYRALGIYSDGHTQDVTNVVHWQSSNTDIATITQQVTPFIALSTDDTTHNNPLGDDEHSGSSAIATATGVGETYIHASLDDINSNQAKLVVDDAVIVSLQLTPASSTIAKGTELYYQVLALYSDDSSKDVTHLVSWLNTAPDVATMVEGHAVAIQEGQTQLTAVLNNIKSNQVTLTVTSSVITALQITPAQASIPKGTEQLYQAFAIYSDNSTQNVTEQASWQSSNTDIVTIDAGDAHAVTVGNVSIQAFMGEQESNLAELTVSSATLTSLQLTPADMSVAKGSHQDYHVIGRYSDQSERELTKEVNWTVSNPTLAIMDKGALQTLEVGVVELIAKIDDLSSNTAKLAINDAKITAIQITPANNEIAKGTELIYSAQAVFSDGSVQDVTQSASWLSSTQQVATINQGIAHAEIPGDTDIVAKLDGKTSNIAKLVVTQATLEKLQVSPASISIALGVEQDFKAIGTYSDNTTQDLTDIVAWNSHQNAIATIVAGHLTSVSKGQTHVTASYQGISSNEASVNVTDKKVAKLQLTPTNISVIKGRSQVLEVKATYTDGSTRFITNEVSWNVAQPVVVSIIDETLTGTSQGSTTIKAYWPQDDIESNSINIMVSAAVLESISVYPESEIVKIGTEKLIRATGHYSDGSEADLTDSVSWTSDNTNIATVVTGRVNGVAVGDVIIFAVMGQFSAQASLQVEHDVLVDILVTPTAVDIPLGTTQQFVATAVYKGGETELFTVADGLSWSTDSVAVDISHTGLANGISKTNGALILATKGAITGTASVNVTDAIVDSIEVKQIDATTSSTITTGSIRQLFAFATYTDGSVVDITHLANWHESSNLTITTVSQGKVEGVATGVGQISASYQNVTSGLFSLTVIETLEMACATPEITIDGLTYSCQVKWQDRKVYGDGVKSIKGIKISAANYASVQDHCASIGARLPTISEMRNLRNKASLAVGQTQSNLYHLYGWPLQRAYWSSDVNDHKTMKVYDFWDDRQFNRSFDQNYLFWTCVK